MKRRLLRVLVACSLLIGAFGIAASPVAAACSSLSISVDDGLGHIYLLPTAGTCTNPSFSDPDLRNNSTSACIGGIGENTHNLNDCINRVRFNGPWPQNYRMNLFYDLSYGAPYAGNAYACFGNSWQNLAHHDEATSFSVGSGTGGCT